MKKIIGRLLAVLGYEMRKIPALRVEKKHGAELLESRLSVKLSLGFDYEENAFEAIQIVKRNTMLPYEALVSLYEQVVYCERNNIPGAIVECGTWKGGAVGLMALANMKHGNHRRHLHLFDSFEEICQGSEAHDDPGILSKTSETSKVKVTGAQPPTALKGVYDEWGGPGSLEINKTLMEQVVGYPGEYLHYHKGWFQDTVPLAPKEIGAISVLRLDGDWYESTRICLEHLYPLVSRGGIVIFDDYGYNIGCRKAVQEYFAKQNIHPLLGYVNKSVRYFVRSW